MCHPTHPLITQALEDAVEYLRDLVVREPRNEGLRGVLVECEAELAQQGGYGQGVAGGYGVQEGYDGQQGAYYGAAYGGPGYDTR